MAGITLEDIRRLRDSMPAWAAPSTTNVVVEVGGRAMLERENGGPLSLPVIESPFVEHGKIYLVDDDAARRIHEYQPAVPVETPEEIVALKQKHPLVVLAVPPLDESVFDLCREEIRRGICRVFTIPPHLLSPRLIPATAMLGDALTQLSITARNLATPAIERLSGQLKTLTLLRSPARYRRRHSKKEHWRLNRRARRALHRKRKLAVRPVYGISPINTAFLVTYLSRRLAERWEDLYINGPVDGLRQRDRMLGVTVPTPEPEPAPTSS